MLDHHVVEAVRYELLAVELHGAQVLGVPHDAPHVLPRLPVPYPHCPVQRARDDPVSKAVAHVSTSRPRTLTRTRAYLSMETCAETTGPSWPRRTKQTRPSLRSKSLAVWSSLALTR
eukprot:scaffold4659_cov352-Prasinococcus_capsulatus_cf.AAC.9